MPPPNRRQFTAKEVDTILEKRFEGQHCTLTLPEKTPVYGIVNRIAMDPRRGHEGEINIQFNGQDFMHQCSVECIHECLKITKKNGDAEPER